MRIFAGDRLDRSTDHDFCHFDFPDFDPGFCDSFWHAIWIGILNGICPDGLGDGLDRDRDHDLDDLVRLPFLSRLKRFLNFSEFQTDFLKVSKYRSKISGKRQFLGFPKFLQNFSNAVKTDL